MRGAIVFIRLSHLITAPRSSQNLCRSKQRLAIKHFIVQKVENGIIYTAKGNPGDSCRQNQYSHGHYGILYISVVSVDNAIKAVGQP